MARRDDVLAGRTRCVKTTKRREVGTVVELLDGAYEVEFSDDEGKTYAQLAPAPDQSLVLHHRPQRAA